MKRRYYCDYCDKSFVDEVEARKKHLVSVFHQRLKKEHYDRCKDPRLILAEELVKQPCRRFMDSGFCQFSGHCKFTHYTKEELWQLKKHIDQENLALKNKPAPEIPTYESWLEKYSQLSVGSNPEDNTFTNVPWSYPDRLELRPDLPPSIIKFKPKHFTNSNFEEWGV